ncbi:hypothetical protein [Emticicia sp. 17c]|uniref:hypothetical protein n=1 Tax=Emticicia sp. 17c TaxID=3127704 RepID=UPI00301D237A
MIKFILKILFITIAFISILLLIFLTYIFFFESNELNNVPKEDWNDNWEKNIQKKLPTYIKEYNLRYSVINNFSNTDSVVCKTLCFIDSVKSNETNSNFHFSFIWTTKHNHKWKVEYVNENYVKDIATLFTIDLVDSFKGKKGEYLINSIEMSNSLENKARTFITIKIVDKTNDTIVLQTDYNEGFNFFLWKRLEEFTRDYVNKNKKNITFTLKNMQSKVLASIKWSSKDKGYKLYLLPKYMYNL